MQGRLLPKYEGRFQAHPVGYWQREFPAASALGLDCIEFVVDQAGLEENPLLRPGGIEEILQAVEHSGVTVRTVCADYLMVAPLHHVDSEIAQASQNALRRLLQNGQALGLTDVVIPCVDQSSLRSSESEEALVSVLLPLAETAGRAGINLSLETDLPPQRFAALLARFDTPTVTANYDTGNSAALGYDPVEELACYGDRISTIHLKDRVLGGGSVMLGTGATQFERFFDALQPLSYSGPFIMQTYRDDEGTGVFAAQLAFVTDRFLPRAS
jgi:L-ribulose-5-phosphate 3-epimerase